MKVLEMPLERFSPKQVEGLVASLHKDLRNRNLEYPIKESIDKCFSDLPKAGGLVIAASYYQDYTNYVYLNQLSHHLQNGIDTIHEVVLNARSKGLKKAFYDDLDMIDCWYFNKKLSNNDLPLPFDAVRYIYNESFFKFKYGHFLKPKLN